MFPKSAKKYWPELAFELANNTQDMLLASKTANFKDLGNFDF